MSLVARVVEEAGIPTVLLGSARDIVEECGVPRFVFTDFPLGNPCGLPGDADMQRANVELALDVVESAVSPRTTVQSPFRWPTDEWRDGFMRVDDSNRAELAAKGEARRRKRAALKESGLRTRE